MMTYLLSLPLWIRLILAPILIPLFFVGFIVSAFVIFLMWPLLKSGEVEKLILWIEG